MLVLLKSSRPRAGRGPSGCEWVHLTLRIRYPRRRQVEEESIAGRFRARLGESGSWKRYSRGCETGAGRDGRPVSARLLVTDEGAGSSDWGGILPW